MSEKYKLAESWHKANIQDRLYYVDSESDLDDWIAEANPTFGDKALCLEECTVWIINSLGQKKQLKRQEA